MLLSGCVKESTSKIIEAEPSNSPTIIENILTPSIIPAPSPTLIPTIQVTPKVFPDLPKVIKNPMPEVVWEGYDCWFIADYKNALWAVWHFVDPSGMFDLTYWEMAYYFPDLGIENGMYSNLYLYNIPYSINGWRVYCEYSNNDGSTKTQMALLTVIPEPITPITPPPMPDPSTIIIPSPMPDPIPSDPITSPEPSPGNNTENNN